MRNGNTHISIHNPIGFLTFYPTYEEWKLETRMVHWLVHGLFILPMRNGNIQPAVDHHLALHTFYPTYEEWKLYPMRMKVPLVKSFLSYL